MHRCLIHCPKAVASTGPWGLGIGVVVAVILYRLYGIWIFLGPILGVAGFIILIVWLSNRPNPTPKKAAHPSGVLRPEPRSVTIEILQDPHRTYTGGQRELCQGGCGREYDRVLIIGSHQLAICGSCEQVAKDSIQQGRIDHILRGLPR